MKARLLILWAWAVLTIAGAARAQATFNLRDPFNGLYSILSTVAEHNGKIYAIGLACDSSNYAGGNNWYLVTGVKFAVFSLNGVKLRDTIYQLPTQVLGPVQGRNMFTWRSHVKVSTNGSFVLAVNSYDTARTMRVALITLDSNGMPLNNVEISRPNICALPEPEGIYFEARSLEPDGYGNWLMLSAFTCDKPGPNSWRGDLLLTKLDSSFSIKWHKIYSSLAWDDDVAERLVVEDDGYLMLSGRYEDVDLNPNSRSQTVLTKVDTAGLLVWQSATPDSPMIGGTDIVRTEDGGYLWCGSGDIRIEDNGAGYYFGYARGYIQKLDSSRQQQWNATVGDIRTSEGSRILQRAVHFLPNGDVVIAGNGVYCTTNPCDSVNWLLNHGTLTRLDALTGQIRWQRRYTAPTDTFFHDIYDMQPTSDGGFVMVGAALDYSSRIGEPIQRGWIIKVDSNGCLGPNDPQCWPTNTPPDTQAPEGARYQLFPNPTTGDLTLRFAHAAGSSEDDATLQLFDVAGRTVASVAITGTSGNQPVNVSSLSSGLYMWRLVHNGEVVARGKVQRQ